MNNIALFLIVIFFSITFLVYGTRGWRQQKTASFAVNDSSTGVVTLVISILASLIGGWMFLGLAAIAFDGGTVAMAIGFGYLIGLVLLALLRFVE